MELVYVFDEKEGEAQELQELSDGSSDIYRPPSRVQSDKPTSEAASDNALD